MARIELNEAEKPAIDPVFEEITKGEEGESRKQRMRKNVVQARYFEEMPEEAINKYQKRAIKAAEVIS